MRVIIYCCLGLALFFVQISDAEAWCWRCGPNNWACETGTSGAATCRVRCDGDWCVCFRTGSCGPGEPGPPIGTYSTGESGSKEAGGAQCADVETAGLVFDRPAMGAMAAASPELALILDLEHRDGLVDLGAFSGGVSRVGPDGPKELYSFEGMAEEYDGSLILEMVFEGEAPVASLSAEFRRDGDLIHATIRNLDASGETISDVGWTSNSPRSK